MFGYITVNKPELKLKEYHRYRACYCGLCRKLKSRAGFVGEMTINYDMTFLILLLNSLYEPSETIQTGRCAVHPVRRHAELLSEFSDYGADMNLLLVYYKQLDDFRDDKSPFGLLASLALRRKALKIAKQYPRQAESIRKELAYLQDLERHQIQDTEKAARSFGRLLGQIFVYKRDMWSHTMYQIGYSLGIYIYVMDAWKDLPEDRRKKRYNPLPFEIATKSAENAVRRQLLNTMAVCARYMERLPLVEDVEILRNIVYSGVWTSFNKKSAGNCRKRGHLEYGEGSI